MAEEHVSSLVILILHNSTCKIGTASEMESSPPEMPPLPHVLCLPFPAQGHINPFLKLAILLHSRGFHITFVNTEYNHRRLLKSRGPDSLAGLPGFRFETIPDGISGDSDGDATQDVAALCESTPKNCLRPLLDLINKLEPPVTCIISDLVMAFAMEAAVEIGVPGFLFRTSSAASLMCFQHIANLVEKGIVPLPDESCLTNGYLDRITIDWLPGMPGIRLGEFSTFIQTTNPEDIVLNFALTESVRIFKASGIIINTFDSLEFDVLKALSAMFPVYPIGPLHLFINQLPLDNCYESIASNLWKEESECIDWLNTREPDSVIYVNFGSVAVLTPEQLLELAWGLANSNWSFLWIVRADLVVGDGAILPPEFVEGTKRRGLISGWCQQEQVLKHPSVGGFLSHCGWNSTLESLSNGVPLICWPFFADQPLNCRFACSEWGVGMQIDHNVSRKEVESLVMELMEGEKGKEMKRRALEWKMKAREATMPETGSSFLSLEKLIKETQITKT